MRAEHACHRQLTSKKIWKNSAETNWYYAYIPSAAFTHGNSSAKFYYYQELLSRARGVGSALQPL